jgi:superfamily II helicase
MIILGTVTPSSWKLTWKSFKHTQPNHLIKKLSSKKSLKCSNNHKSSTSNNKTFELSFQGRKCAYMLCRACCREKTFTEHLNCRSHRFKCDQKQETREVEVDINNDTRDENRTEECSSASEPIT